METENKDNLYCYKHPHPSVTTDCAVFGFDGNSIMILLIRRGSDPFKGYWALPGGFVRMEESADEGALRELREETGINNIYIRQFHTFSDPFRDPRERVITIGYYALVHIQEVKGMDDADEARWFALKDIPTLAFDHNHILRTAIDELRKQIHFEPIGYSLLPETFTFEELQNLYEAILGVKLESRNLYNKIKQLGILEQLEEKTEPTSRKQASLFRFNIEKYRKLKLQGIRVDF